MPFILVFLLSFICLHPAATADANPADYLLIQPYWQLGKESSSSSPDNQSFELLYGTSPEQKDNTQVEWQRKAECTWQSTKEDQQSPPLKSHNGPSIVMHKVRISGLKAAEELNYRLKDKTKNNIFFSGSFQANKDSGSAYKFVVFGDCGANSRGQRHLAYRLFQEAPDFVHLTGDLVYSHGRISEYLDKFFPIYNGTKAGPMDGGPLMSSTLFTATAGNHDVWLGSLGLSGNLKEFSDGLAYFQFWSQPLNGPIPPSKKQYPPIIADTTAKKAFLASTENRFPQMTNFSFDYANSHWTVLDGNGYTNWNEKSMRAWLEADLAKAKSAKWKFVAFHQPGFSVGGSHFKEQRMRLICDILEKNNVDVVFNGHAHSYQRTYPLNFKAAKTKTLPLSDGTVPGDFDLDKDFDGIKVRNKKGIIYIVTGCGGAALTGGKLAKHPKDWPPFIAKYIAGIHSYTLCKVEGGDLTIKQIAEDGSELDSFRISK